MKILYVALLAFFLVGCSREIVVLQDTPPPQVYAMGSFLDNNGVTFPIAASGVYYNITLFDTILYQGVSVVNNKSVIVYEGTYSFNYHMSFGGGPTVEYHTAIGVNGLEKSECHGARVIGTGGDVGNMGGSCLLYLEAGDVVTFMVENEDNTLDITIKDVSVNMVLI